MLFGGVGVFGGGVWVGLVGGFAGVFPMHACDAEIVRRRGRRRHRRRGRRRHAPQQQRRMPPQPSAPPPPRDTRRVSPSSGGGMAAGNENKASLTVRGPSHQRQSHSAYFASAAATRESESDRANRCSTQKSCQRPPHPSDRLLAPSVPAIPADSPRRSAPGPLGHPPALLTPKRAVLQLQKSGRQETTLPALSFGPRRRRPS